MPTISAAPTTESRSIWVKKWEERSAWPMFLFALTFFVSSVWLLTGDHLGGARAQLLGLLIIVLWLCFIIDFLLRMAISPHRVRFIRARWYELASLLVPVLRPYLIVVYVWRLPIFRRFGAAGQRVRYLACAGLFTLLFVYIASTAVWYVERNAPGATIVNLGDAIWWGFCTVSTVGYGDFIPVTLVGRILAVGLMLSGVLVFGVTSAAFISAINDQIKRATQVENSADRINRVL